MSKENEPVPTQILLHLSETVRRYASEDIFWNPAYNRVIGEVGLKVGADKNTQIHIRIGLAMGLGIEMVTTRIRQLVIFSDPRERTEMAQKIERGELQGRWLLRLVKWNPQEDPYGLEVLEECKRQDMEEIIEKAKEAKDEQEEIQIRAQAEAVGRSQDLVIEFYKKQIGSAK